MAANDCPAWQDVLDATRRAMMEATVRNTVAYRDVSGMFANRLLATVRGTPSRGGCTAAIQMLRDDCQCMCEVFARVARLNMDVHRGRYSVMIADIVRV